MINWNLHCACWVSVEDILKSTCVRNIKKICFIWNISSDIQLGPCLSCQFTRYKSVISQYQWYRNSMHLDSVTQTTREAQACLRARASSGDLVFKKWTTQQLRISTVLCKTCKKTISAKCGNNVFHHLIHVWLKSKLIRWQSVAGAVTCCSP